MKVATLSVLVLSLFNAYEAAYFIHISEIHNLTSNIIYMYEEQTTNFSGIFVYSSFNGSSANETLTLKCWSSYEKVGVIVDWTDIVIKQSSIRNSSLIFDLKIFARRLGGSKLMCSVTQTSNSSKLYESSIAQLIVNRESTVVEMVFRVSVIICIIFLTFSMACGLDIQIILGYLKRPVSLAIGFSSQFIFMPLIAAGLGKLTGIENSFGLGLLTIGCSPGGGASNIWTVLFGGDLNLSMVMTFISSCAAIGMMPFWMFVLSRLFIDPSNVYIPYGNICLNLLQIVAPAALGMGFRWKWKDKAIALSKKVRILGILFVIFILTFGTYVNLYIFKLMGDYLYLLPIGALLPWLGFIFGCLLSVITRRKLSQTIAIALETGFQNIGIAIIILKFSMPQPDGDLAAVMPVIVAIFTPLPLYIGYFILFIKRKYFPNKSKIIDVNMDSLADQHNETVVNLVI